MEALDDQVRLASADLQIQRACELVCGRAQGPGEAAPPTGAKASVAAAVRSAGGASPPVPQSSLLAQAQCRTLLLQGALEELLFLDYVPGFLSNRSYESTFAKVLWQPYTTPVPRGGKVKPKAVRPPQSAEPGFKEFDYAAFTTLAASYWTHDLAYPSSVLIDREGNDRLHGRAFKINSTKHGVDPKLLEAVAFDEQAAGAGFQQDVSKEPFKVNGEVYVEEPVKIDGDKAVVDLVSPKAARPKYGAIPNTDVGPWLYANASRCVWPSLARAKSDFDRLSGKLKDRAAIRTAIGKPHVAELLKAQWPAPGDKLAEALLQ
jgi:hypothetical protein